MESLTIHMDDALAQLIRKKAAAEGKSLNKTINGVLKEALGLQPTNHRADFLDQCGAWSTEERTAFDASTRRQIDPEDWAVKVLLDTNAFKCPVERRRARTRSLGAGRVRVYVHHRARRIVRRFSRGDADERESRPFGLGF